MALHHLPLSLLAHKRIPYRVHRRLFIVPEHREKRAIPSVHPIRLFVSVDQILKNLRVVGFLVIFRGVLHLSLILTHLPGPLFTLFTPILHPFSLPLPIPIPFSPIRTLNPPILLPPLQPPPQPPPTNILRRPNMHNTHPRPHFFRITPQ